MLPKNAITKLLVKQAIDTLDINAAGYSFQAGTPVAVWFVVPFFKLLCFLPFSANLPLTFYLRTFH